MTEPASAPEHWLDELSTRIANLLGALESGEPCQMEFLAALAELKARGFRFIHTAKGPRIEPMHQHVIQADQRRRGLN